MKVCHTLIFFFLTLQDGNIGLINAEIPIFIRTEGQSITVQCPYTYTGERTYFCKDRCIKDFLYMYDVRVQRGRYIMEYKNTRAGSRLHVTITQLTKSDSGLYGCGLENLLSIDQYMEFQIIVTNAPSTSKPNLTLRPSVRSVQSASTPTTKQSFRRSSTTSFSAETTNQSEEEQTEISAGGSAPSTSKPNLTLRPSLTSVQSASTPATTQSFRRSSTTSFSAETTNQSVISARGQGILFPLVVSVTVVVVLLAVFLPLLHKWKKRGSSNNVNSRAPLTSTNMEPVYENSAPVSTLEDYENVNPSSTYETLNPITMAQDQTYSTLNRATQE